VLRGDNERHEMSLEMGKIPARIQSSHRHGYRPFEPDLVFLAFRNMHNTPRSQRAASRRGMSFKERVKKPQSCRARRVLPARLLKSLSPRSSRPVERMYRPLSIIDPLEPLNVGTFSRLGLYQLIRRLLTTAVVRVPNQLRNGCTLDRLRLRDLLPPRYDRPLLAWFIASASDLLP
jgi:hypothetical protein